MATKKETPKGTVVKGPLPPVLEEARVEERRDPGRCKNCGRVGTLTTRISCNDCGHTLPPA